MEEGWIPEAYGDSWLIKSYRRLGCFPGHPSAWVLHWRLLVLESFHAFNLITHYIHCVLSICIKLNSLHFVVPDILALSLWSRAWRLLWGKAKDKRWKGNKRKTNRMWWNERFLFMVNLLSVSWSLINVLVTYNYIS